MTHSPETLSGGRRRLVDWLGRIFLSLWGVGLLGVVTSFIRGPKGRSARGGSRQVRAGPLDALPVGHGRLVPHGERPLLVIRPRADQIVALSAICTHLRCVLHWDAERSIVACPCHAGAFDLRGNVLSGPPGGPLPQYQAEVRGGEIYVNL